MHQIFSNLACKEGKDHAGDQYKMKERNNENMIRSDLSKAQVIVESDEDTSETENVLLYIAQCSHLSSSLKIKHACHCALRTCFNYLVNAKHN